MPRANRQAALKQWLLCERKVRLCVVVVNPDSPNSDRPTDPSLPSLPSHTHPSSPPPTGG
jgi:hypothetical protein